MSHELLELAKLLQYLRNQQELESRALLNGDERNVVRARHRHDVYRELAEDLEAGSVKL